MRVFHVAALAIGLLLAANQVQAVDPPAKAAPAPVSLESAKKEIVGYWRINVDEATIRQGLEAMAKKSPQLVIDGKLVQPTDAQREEFLKKTEKEIPAELERAKKQTEDMLLRCEADGVCYRIMKSSPLPQFPRFKKGTWTLSTENGKVYCSMGADQQQEKAVIESIGNGEMVLGLPPGMGPAGMTVKFLRVADPPKWATELTEEKPAAPAPGLAPAPAPPAPAPSP